MKTDKDNKSKLLARIAALESELRRLLDLVGVEDRESIESVLSDEMAEHAEMELERLKAELLAVKVTEEHTFAAQRIAEADVEELKRELEKRDAIIKEMKEALECIINSAVHPDVAIRSVMVPLDPIRKALTKAKEAGL